ncbi:ATP-dependent RNA helicase eIF4A [Orchesella cincta]|uniref:ATP-dependent RNA helicase n=1 Tax=Orchesella cincta TaxID=48709 RepID=A0A1D2NJH4_ORCCI|nr:ATP-dependent RNA helicase eIF4A [Orchesella cincta]
MTADLKKYMALDNILITVEESTKDDRNVLLPDISKSDMFVEKHLETDLSEWQRLKLECQKLNYETQTAFLPNICKKLFRVTVSKDLTAEEQYRKAVEMANALNMHRGKKYITMGQSAPVNESAAARYVHNYYAHVIQDVVGKEYCHFMGFDEFSKVGRRIDITEVPANSDNFDSHIMCQTIHVQAKATSANSNNSMPQTITLYQFEDTSTLYKPPDVTTFNVETASPIRDLSLIEEYTHTRAGSSKSCIMVPPSHFVEPTKSPANRRCQSVTGSLSDTLSETSNILAILGIEDVQRKTSETPVSKLPSPVSTEKKSANTSRLSASTEESQKTNPTSEEESEDLDNSIRIEEVDGVRLRGWLWPFVLKNGIKRFTAIQKQFLRSFAVPGDIHYKGVANGGKTMCAILAILNSIQPLQFDTQALIVTSNTRSSKLIQKTVSFEDGENKIICQRTDEIFTPSNSNAKKNTRRPVCQVVVGTCEQIKDVIAKNILNSERINHLIIDNAEEIFSEGLKTTLYKILYSLDATIKVTLISRTSANAASELEEFCKQKLRYTLVLEETVDIEQFLNSQPRVKSGDKAVHSISDKRSVVGNGTPPRNQSVKEGCIKPSASVPKSSDIITSTTHPDDYTNDEPKVIELSDSDEADESYDSDNESTESTCRTFIPNKAIKFLGVDDSGTMVEGSGSAVSHLYANIAGDDYKVEIIAQLDIEEDKTIIFCNSIERTEWLSTKLRQHQLWPQVLHQNIPRKEQEVILETFRQGSFCRVLISTDFLTSISLDSADVVLNYDLPATKMVYRNRTAFADRELLSTKSIVANKSTIVISLISENEYETLMGFGSSLGIVVESAYKDQD